jgi:ubiquinone/menaquinone biosynthesis C-methylase UbiE
MERAAFGEKVLLDVLRGLEFRTYTEVGCGFGRILKRVVDTFAPNAVGVDLSLDQLREARAYVPTAAGRLAAGVAERLPLRDGSTDLVLASEVLMHLDPEQVATAIREMARVTRRYIVSVDWYENFMVGEQVQHNFVHDYSALYAREGFSVRQIPVGGFTLHSMFIAERT